MFAIDFRSLATFRIGIALILLCDLGRRTLDLSAFYTDDGILPRIARMEMLGYGDPLGFQHQWSFHMLNGEWWAQAGLLLVAAWFACSLLIGYRSRLAVFACWLLTVSIDNRNPLVLDAGDTLLRGLLFWSLFLPLGARWSLDRALRGTENNPPRAGQSIPTAALLLQIAIMYWVTAASKWHPVWTHDFSAVYYALHSDTLVTRWGLILREYPRVMQVLTGSTLVIEFLVPMLAFSPWKRHWCRVAAVAVFGAFHGGMYLTLELGLFPWICFASWMVFVPSEFWDGWSNTRSARRLQAWWQRIAEAIRAKVPAAWGHAWERRAELPRLRWGWVRQTVVAGLFLYIGIWNVRELLGPAWVDRIMPHRFNGVACALGMVQNWEMFAPYPRIDDGWLVMRGTLQDGSVVNLWRPGQPLPWSKPRLLSATFPDSRWQVYLANIPLDRNAFHRQYLANWLQRRWDSTQAGARDDRKVTKIEIFKMLEVTPRPGERAAPPESIEVCTRYYSPSPVD